MGGYSPKLKPYSTFYQFIEAHFTVYLFIQSHLNETVPKVLASSIRDILKAYVVKKKV